MIEYVLLGLYLYFEVKVLFLIKNKDFKFLHKTGFHIVEVLCIALGLSIIFGILQSTDIAGEQLIPQNLFLITFIFLIITLGIASGMSFIINKFHGQLKTNLGSELLAFGKTTNKYSNIWIIINAFVIYFLFSMVETSLEKTDYAKYNSDFLSIPIIFFAVLFGFSVCFFVKKFSRTLVGISLSVACFVFSLVFLLLFIEKNVVFDLKNYPIMNTFLAFSVSFLFSNFIFSFYKFIKNLIERKTKSENFQTTNSSPNHQKEKNNLTNLIKSKVESTESNETDETEIDIGFNHIAEEKIVEKEKKEIVEKRDILPANNQESLDKKDLKVRDGFISLKDIK